jgi:hypothetical protein
LRQAGPACALGVQELKPRLDELVEQEARWLEEQEAVRGAEQAAAAAAELERQQVEGWEEEGGLTADGASAAACGEGTAEACRAQGSGEEGGPAAADWGDRGLGTGRREEADLAGTDAAGADVGDVGADDEADGEAGAAAVGDKERQGAADGEDVAAAEEEEEEEELLDDIDSPWAEVRSPSRATAARCLPASHPAAADSRLVSRSPVPARNRPSAGDQGPGRPAGSQA